MSSQPPGLNFTLSPEATGHVYEALVCLAKFGESVSIEARNDKFTLIALNLSKTAYAACTLDAKTFFTTYAFIPGKTVHDSDRFTGQLYNKALQCAFKGRTGDPRGREIAIDYCHVSVQERPDKAECRMVVKMHYKQGMTKCYRLTYEPTQIMHALFDKTSASQGWKISSRIMREYIEYFGPKTEQLDLLAQDGKAIFTSFTEKIQDGKEVLKQPLETSIALHIEDFEDFHVREQVHIVISVKDFRAIVTHAETLHGSLSASFSVPAKPMQMSYGGPGIQCDFTLMTTGDHAGVSIQSRPNFISTRSSARQPTSTSTTTLNRSNSEMLPPALPGTKHLNSGLGTLSQAKKLRLDQPTPAVSQQDPDPESLFMPPNEEQSWEPHQFEDDGQEELLGYDASYTDQEAAPHPTFRDTTSVFNGQVNLLSMASESQEGLEPTQRLSQLHGMFD
ncbi:hypothetical protein AMS68_001209 [Peltaster fructicola]|uniref:DNA repair protein rad9 n=1 Tax=Peltaster fructicola TaxID=286661 RepID=A0A6H0XLR5_9PEZI|nr:hypothetical protein AMS68_001209 [Peltaster fructicola]